MLGAMNATILNLLCESITASATYNPNVQVAPSCILWPDKNREWESIIPRLQEKLPQLLVLGTYKQEAKQGPAIWLRSEIVKHTGEIPILYIPGYSRQDLRAIETCPDELKPIAELQYRGALWSQVNAKDWTAFAYLKSDQGGLGLDVASDNDTKNALLLALGHLLNEDVDHLKGKHLDRDYFNQLVTGGDSVRDLLLWIDHPDTFKSSRSSIEWQAFLDVTKSAFAFQPDKDGELKAAERLAKHQGTWAKVWDRFCESPTSYPNIPATILRVNAPAFGLFSGADECSGWPQWNADQEVQLRTDLKSLSPLHDVVGKVAELDRIHGIRRQLVWSKLGLAPLAQALEHLQQLAVFSRNALASGDFTEMANQYTAWGYKVDACVIKALQAIDTQEDQTAVFHAIQTLYVPWLDTSAQALQAKVKSSPYPGNTLQGIAQTQEGDCLLFVDGLRMDVAQQLKEHLEKGGYSSVAMPRWCPLPSVTATGKVAIAPVAQQFLGLDNADDFEPVRKLGSQKGTYALRKAIQDDGFTLLEKNDFGNGIGKAWCEFGDLDHEGHERDWKLAKQLPVLLRDIVERIHLLLNAGWKRVRVLTDHGWLLIPGGLPKVELNSALVDSKWGRCASIKPGANVQADLYPWAWNTSVFFALPQGISCYRKAEYSHGGLSLQECLTLEILVSKGSQTTHQNIEITDLSWKGLRCGVNVEGALNECIVDIRKNAGDAATSVAMEPKSVDSNGIARVLVEDDALEGLDAFVVVLGANGVILAQRETKIGRSN